MNFKTGYPLFLTISIVCLILFSCKNEDTSKTSYKPVEEALSGEDVFNQNNCTACHKPDQKVVGPSLQDIARIYKGQKGDMVAFLKEEAKPIVDPEMYESMRINLQITKTLSDEELKALENYILNHSK